MDLAFGILALVGGLAGVAAFIAQQRERRRARRAEQQHQQAEQQRRAALADRAAKMLDEARAEMERFRGLIGMRQPVVLVDRALSRADLIGAAVAQRNNPRASA